MIKDNVGRVLGRIEAVCRKIGRDPGEITLVAITKYAQVPEILEAVRAGVVHIGENRIQDAREKFLKLETSGLKVTRHMVGHLQTNKVKNAVEMFDFIQSVDSLKLATALEHQAARLNKTVNVLLQVNTAGEHQKFGVELSEVFAFVKEMASFHHIHLRGFMTMAPLTENTTVIRKCFRDLRVMRDQVQERFGSAVDVGCLSMGMTGDYEIALEEGASMVRIGRAIFQE